MKKLFYILLLLGSTYVFAQNKGMTYQAVIYAPGGQNVPGVNVANLPLANRTICLQFSLLDATSAIEYQEVVKIKTDEFGMVNITIGSGTQTGGYATSFAAVVWSASADKSMKVALDATGLCNQYEELSVEKLDAVPFANAAITAGNVSGVVALTNGGTGATTAAGARTNLGIGNVDNTSDLNKPMSTATKTYIDSQLTNSTIVDADANTKGKIQLAGDLAGTAVAPTVPGLALKENAANKSTTTTLGTSNVLFPTQNAVKTYVDTAIAGATIVDADANTKGKIQLAGDLGGTASAPTVPGLALKLDASLAGVPNGVATLNSAGIIPANQLPPISVASTNVVGSQAQMLALSNATVGSIAVRTDVNKNFILSTAGPSVLANWIELLTPGAPVQSVNGLTGAIQLSKADINLANVDNTSDAAKPVSTATQNALNLKLNTNQVGVPNGTASLNALGKIPTDQIPAISFSSVKVLGSQAEMLAQTNALVGSVVIRTDVNKNYVLAQSDPSILANWLELLTPAPPVQSVNGYVGNVSLTKADLGLGNVDNTGDINKPVSTPTQNALDLKANLASPTFTGTVSGITKSMVGLANVDNTTDLNKPVSTPTQNALDLKANLASPTFSGTVSGITKAMVGLGNVDNTTDAAKPVSTATQTALDLKANLASPTFTGTVSGIDKTMVGLGNVDNTTDAAKPVSTATQTALDLKENAANKTTATDLGNTAPSDQLFPSQKAVKTYVDTAISSSSTTAVPYTGATGAVNLGAYDLAVNGITVGKGSGAKSDNTVFGVNALSTNSTGNYNTAIGTSALKVATAGYNTAIGNSALYQLTSGTYNTAIGYATLATNTDKVYNTAVGSQSMRKNAGNFNTALGESSLYGYANSPFATGDYNTAIGYQTLQNVTTAANNVALGAKALNNLTGGNENTVIGYNSGLLYGSGAGTNLTGLTQGVLVGSGARTSANNSTNEIAIGYGVVGNGSNTVTIGNSSTTANYFTGSLNSTGQLISTVADGTAPLVVTSTTPVANLNIAGNAANVTGTVAIANGGTGQTTKTAAFDALSPMTSAGDIMYGATNGTGTRLAKGTDGQVLKLVSGLPSWQSDIGFEKEVSKVNFGAQTGFDNQAEYTTAIGPYAGMFYQGINATAVGRNAGNSVQGASAVAVGHVAGASNQGTESVAVGYRAGLSDQGAKSVAIGAFAGYANQHANSIILNATGAALNSDNASALYIAPIRSATNTNVLLYNPTTKEVTTSANIPGNADNVTGTVAIANGGTGATTAAAALTNLGAEPTANKTTATDLGNTAPSDQLFPSQKAVKTYVDTAVSSSSTTAVPYTGASGAVNLGAYDMTVNGITVGVGANGTTVTTSNTAMGLSALAAANSGTGNNTAIGNKALNKNTTGHSNTAIGGLAMAENATGTSNVAIGSNALNKSTAGIGNTAIGNSAGYYVTSNYNTIIGQSAGGFIKGINNIGIGYAALNMNGSVTSGADNNIALGTNTLFSAVRPISNIVIGYEAGRNFTNGSYNVALGQNTAFELTDATYNTILGHSSGRGITTGSENTIIGSRVGNSVALSPTLTRNIILADGAGNIRAQHDGTNGWSLGTITSGTWNGTTIAVANGGTGATTAAAALTNLGAEPTANKSTATNLGATSPSDDLFPTQKAVKTYVDAQTAAAGVSDGSITSAKILDGTIANIDVSSTAAIAYTKLNLASSIVVGDLADDAVETTKIKDVAVTEAKLAANAVTSSKIKDGEIATADIATAAITFAKIQNLAADKVLGRVTAGSGVIEEIATTGSGDVVRSTSPTLVTPVIGAATGTSLSVSGQLTSTIADGTAPFVVTSTTPVANLSIGGNAATVTTNANLTGDVTSSGNATTIGANKVITGMIANANITNAKLDKANIPLSGFGAAAADVALGANKLTGVADPTLAQDAATKNYVDTATSAITTLADGKIYLGNASNVATEVTPTGDVTMTNAGVTAIGSGKVVVGMLATDAVETIKIKDANVTAAKLATDAVETAKIKDAAVETAKVKDANITYAKIQNVSATNKVLGRVSANAGVVEEIATTGSGDVVRATSPTLVTPNLGTPSAVDLTNALALPLTSGVTGILPVANGGTGSATQNFVDLTTAQTIAGVKTFSSDMIVNSVNIGRGNGAIATNTAVGTDAISATATGTENAALGYNALKVVTSGARNAVVGSQAAKALLTGIDNIALGYRSLSTATSSESNTAIGSDALKALGDSTNDRNTAVGTGSFSNLTTGQYNVAVGQGTFLNATSGSNNVGVGKYAGFRDTNDVGVTSSNKSVFIGAETKPLSSTSTNEIVIGYDARGLGNNTMVLGNSLITQAKVFGALSLPDGTESTSSTTGALKVTGGVGIAKSLTVGSTTTSSSTTTGALKVAGGVGIVENLNVGGNVKITGTIEIDGGTPGAGKVLTSDANGVASWTSLSGVTSIGTISASSTANGASITSGVLNLAPADATNGGVVNTTNQTFAGSKTFNSDISVNTVKIGKGNGTGSGNTALGSAALNANTTGSYNTMVGGNSGVSNTTGQGNVSLGYSSLNSNTTGSNNISIGNAAMNGMNTYNYNVGIGQQALRYVKGNYNVAIGDGAGANLGSAATTGTDNNIMIGGNAGYQAGVNGSNTAGKYSIFIGHDTRPAADAETNEIVISGYDGNAGTIGLGSNSTLIGNSATTQAKIFGALTLPSTTASTSTTTGALIVSGGAGIAGALNVGTTAKIASTTLSTSNSTGALVVSGGAGIAGKMYVGDGTASNNTTSGGVIVSGGLGVSGNINFGGNLNGLTVGRGPGTGSFNTVFGETAMINNSTGNYNTAVGYGALTSNTAGSSNIALGYNTLNNFASPTSNIAIGDRALVGGASASGVLNLAIGTSALNAIIGGDRNIALGGSAGNNLTSGAKNIYIGAATGSVYGSGSGTANTTSSNSVLIGYDVRPSANGNTNEIVISGYNGSTSPVGLGSNTTLLGNSATTNTKIWGALDIPNTTSSTSSTTGSLTVGGGAGIAGALNVGTTATITGATTISSTTASSSTTTGALKVGGGVGIVGNTYIGGTLSIAGGTPGAGKVLTSDANGLASWSNGVGSAVTTTTAAYAITLAESIVFYTGSAAGTFSIPAAASTNTGKEIIIKNKTGFGITVTPASGTIYIDNANAAAASVSLGIEASNNWIKLVSDGTQWNVLRALF